MAGARARGGVREGASRARGWVAAQTRAEVGRDMGASAGMDAADEGPLFGPRWTRLGLGAAVAMVAVGLASILNVKASYPAGVKVPPPDAVLAWNLLTLVLPAAFAGTLSWVADLGRDRPRVALAVQTGLAGLISAFIAKILVVQVNAFLLPLAAVGPFLFRAYLTPPRAGQRTVDHVLQWTFTGVLAVVLAGLASAFVTRNVSLAAMNGLQGFPASPGTDAWLRQFWIFVAKYAPPVAAGFAPLLGAALTEIWHQLDPDRAPEAEEPPSAGAP